LAEEVLECANEKEASVRGTPHLGGTKEGHNETSAQGYQWGAWIVRLRRKQRIFRSNGSGYPELDKLYKPKPPTPDVPEPKHWRDYTNTLRPYAFEKFEGLLSKEENR
jgi:hypothetical protein